MGWLVSSDMPKLKTLVAERIRIQEWSENGTQTKDVVLRHCYRGGRWSGVLWTVHERTVTYPDGKATVERWIGCELVRYYAKGRGVGNWGYKSMDICMGPYEFSCPPSYVAMVPVHEEDPKCHCHGWRKAVAEYQAKQDADREKARDLHLNDVVDLKEGCHPRQVVIVSLRPLVGECGGRRYKIKMNQLA